MIDKCEQGVKEETDECDQAKKKEITGEDDKARNTVERQRIAHTRKGKYTNMLDHMPMISK